MQQIQGRLQLSTLLQIEREGTDRENVPEFRALSVPGKDIESRGTGKRICPWLQEPDQSLRLCRVGALPSGFLQHRQRMKRAHTRLAIMRSMQFEALHNG
jgi:hypothetical protein